MGGDVSTASRFPTVQLRRVARLEYGESLPRDAREDGSVHVFGSNGPVDTHVRSNTAAPVVVVGRKGSFGKVHWSDDPVFAIDTTYFVDVTKTHSHLRWLYWVLLAARLDAVTQDTGVPGLSREVAYQTPIPLPPLPIQRAIADFLDRETGRIDALMEKKRRLIELLEEKRSALITHTVTKGLDPTVPMKDSGIPWLGEIPEHWEILPLRRVAQLANSNVDKKAVEGEIPVRLCNYTDVYYASYLDSTEGFMEATATPEEIRRFRLRADTVLMTKDSESPDDIGVPAYVSRELEAVCGYHLTILVPDRRRLRGDFLYWTLESSALRAAFETAAKGVTRYGLTLDGIGSTVVPVPPLFEQAAIAEQLRARYIRSVRAIERLTTQLDKLAEYRQALITAAVTGELEIAPDPEEVAA
jgi:type I restriction enzyme S subunit